MSSPRIKQFYVEMFWLPSPRLIFPQPARDNTLKVWDLESGWELRTLAGHSSSVNGVAVTADGRRAVSASGDNTLKVWDLESGTVIAGFTCDGAASHFVFVGSDRIFGGDSGGRLYLLRLET